MLRTRLLSFGFAVLVPTLIHADDRLARYDGYPASMICEASTNIGIGSELSSTCAPAYPLHVKDDTDYVACFEGTDHAMVFIKGTDDADRSISFLEGNSVEWKIGMDNDNLAGYGEGDTEAFVIKRYNNEEAEFQLDTNDSCKVGSRFNSIASPATGSTISGGGSATYPNQIGSSANWSSIIGGLENHITSSYAIAGGISNVVAGNCGVALGNDNVASGHSSVALGNVAAAYNDGDFVFSDTSSATSFAATTPNQFKVRATNGAWFSNQVSAASYQDRTPYPKDLETAYNAVQSMSRLPDDEYDEYVQDSQLDHGSLSEYVAFVEADGTISRNLSATVSAQNEVIKDLISRIKVLEESTSKCICAR